MKNLFKKRALALVMATAMALVLVLPVSAVSRTLQVTPVPLKINGLAAKTTDVKGKQTEALYSDGTTYVPVRGLSEALGTSATWNSATKSVEVGTEGDTPANDAAYLKEYFDISPMSGTVSWATFNAALKKVGADTQTASGTLTAASAAKGVVAAANMTQLAQTYSAETAASACARYGTIAAADQPYVACAIQMGLIPNSVDFTAPLTGDVASVILMNAVESAGKGRNYIGFSSDPDIAARLVSTWNSFTLFDDATLTDLGVSIVKSGATTGYNLKYDGNAARFLSENTIQYGHSDITHAVQLMGLLDRAGLVARVQLEPKVSAYQYLLEWSDGKLPASTPRIRSSRSPTICMFALQWNMTSSWSSPLRRTETPSTSSSTPMPRRAIPTPTATE